MKIVLTSLLIFASVVLSRGQKCRQYFDFNQFSKKGTPEANWEVTDTNNVITTEWVFPPTFYVNSDEMINVLIKGTLSVETSADYDFIGIVFGYKAPLNIGNENNYTFYLFDWRAKTDDFKGYTAFEGFRLSHYNGFIPSLDFKKYFWGAVNTSPTRTLLEQKYGDDLGWEPFKKYEFELLYTSNRIRVSIDGNVIFEREGCFASGRFGLYSMSQYATRFENFSYRNTMDFKPIPLAACVGDTVLFQLFDLDCSPFPGFVSSVSWDFGDGQTSSEINPEHVFTEEGTYTVNCLISQFDGCVDTLKTEYKVKPNPVVKLEDPGLVAACTDVSFDAGNTGADYEWSTGEDTQSIIIKRIPHDTTVWVKVNLDGCTGSDTVFVEVTPIQDILYFPNAFSPNGDGLNDEFTALGNTENVFSYSLLVYDRWGKILLESEDPGRGWDGYYKGTLVPAGTYVYKAAYRIESSCVEGEDHSATGTVTLVR